MLSPRLRPGDRDLRGKAYGVVVPGLHLRVGALVRQPLSVIRPCLILGRSPKLVQPLSVVHPRLRLDPSTLVGEPGDMGRPGRPFELTPLGIELRPALAGQAVLLLALRLLEHPGELVGLASAAFLLRLRSLAGSSPSILSKGSLSSETYVVLGPSLHLSGGSFGCQASRLLSGSRGCKLQEVRLFVDRESRALVGVCFIVGLLVGRRCAGRLEQVVKGRS